MTILIVFLSFLFAAIALGIVALANDEDLRNNVPAAIIAPIVTFVFVFLIGTAILTRDERAYVESFKAQKQTIEQSLSNEELTGLERVQLVTKAAELNGEFARRKTEYKAWYNVYFDNTIYDGVEPISMGGKQ